MHIEFTLSTIPLGLLTAYLWYRTKGQLLPVVTFMSIFQAASVVNINIAGSQIGLGAAYILLLVAVVGQIAGRRTPDCSLHSPRSSTTLLISLFVVYATASVLIYPRLFAGVPFSNPKFGNSAALEFKSGFLPQLIYLIVCTSLYFVAAYRTPPAHLSKALNWYVGGAVLASFIAIYQYVCMKTGLPFPTEFLHSNPVYVIFEGYEINGFPRMDATFTEASAAAFVFASALSVSLYDLLSRRITLTKLATSLSIFVGLLLTISTTGYICLIFIALVFGWLYFFRSRSAREERSIRLLLAIPVVAGILIVLATPSAMESFNKLAHTVILDKTQSDSYVDRSQSNQSALDTASQTIWLGAGWGVCRASSIVPTILGNVGLPGFLLLTSFAAQSFLPLIKRNKIKGPIHGAVLFALATIWLDLIVSGPELNQPILWLLLAIAARLSAIGANASYRERTLQAAPSLKIAQIAKQPEPVMLAR